MSIASEIERLQNAKSALKTAIEGKGVSVPASTTLDGYSALVDSIQAGGGSSDDYEFMRFFARSGSEFEAPLGEKNLLITIITISAKNVKVVNSSTSKYFTYYIPAGNQYWFICEQNSNSVHVSTGTKTNIQ